MDYLRPADLDEAIRLRQGTGFALLAGGTDLYPAIEHGRRCAGLIDLSRVEALRGPVRIEGDSCILPALTTWDALRHAALPPLFDALKAASGEIGGRQIQNTGTLGGNLCNASPAADGNAVLLALDASVLLAGPAGRRELPLGEFLLGNRRTALEAGEILAAIRVPLRRGRHGSAFRKLGARRYLVISIVMACVVVEDDGAGRATGVRVSVGACADRPLRLPALEARIEGRPIAALGNVAMTEDDLAPLRPLDDVRGSADYRMAGARALVQEALAALALELAP